ncbi:hypothetical protein ACQKOK_28245 [Bacillus cereus]|uniref:hypothetical protein n=1 Tax=Bacillus cereus TaxID=1396 RepID=UPI003D088E37
MIKVERENQCICESCGNTSAFYIRFEGELFNPVETFLCEKCTAELKEKIGRFIY